MLPNQAIASTPSAPRPSGAEGRGSTAARLTLSEMRHCSKLMHLGPDQALLNTASKQHDGWSSLEAMLQLCLGPKSLKLLAVQEVEAHLLSCVQC
jgi:hypothetical protein